jgi:hypothetical protein
MTLFAHSCFSRAAARSSVGDVQQERLTVARTVTGYWVVQRGTTQLAGALTRDAAEHERKLAEGLRRRCARRSRDPRRALVRR